MTYGEPAETSWSWVLGQLQRPGVGWMQGAAGISAYLFRLQRAVDGDQTAVERMDNWFSL